jgi:phospholipid transport system substrate-binding protein
MKSLLYAVLALSILSNSAIADDRNTVEKLLKGKLDAVLLVLQNQKLDQQAKKDEISTIIMPVFDFPLMAKLTLGRKHWPGMTKEQQAKFTELFIRLLKESYLEKISLYSDERIVFHESVQVKRKVHIATDLISKDNKISMLYKFYKSKHGWRIYDIEIEGISLIVTYRSQFDQVLNEGTVDDLIIKLEKSEKT